MRAYDAIAPDFDRHRTLPAGVAEAVRSAILAAALPARPRILDLGAGSGRLGHAFVAAGDDYTGLDLSFGMLSAFAARTPDRRLVQAAGTALPFADASFDAVLLIQVLSSARQWRALLNQAIRVLRPAGALIVGRVVAPQDGIDAQMKSRLAEILGAMDIHPYRDKPRDDALSWLARTMPDPHTVTAAAWTTLRTPAAFLERHAGGSRFATLPDSIKQQAMRRLAAWAAERVGPLGTAVAEPHRFELTIFRQGTRHAPAR